ncbi:hypothetical protein C8Q76DRAFT_822272 [Earliella scabrosa]|nr:hypothetical protein C8Q76DRAFT_822272 [Earliella scabrosa]
MPQRPATPPSPDDSLFLTVVNPYPAQPYQNYEDSKSFARWIACIVGEKNLRSYYHKPSSPNAVIIELTDEYTNLRRVLGAHRWHDILQDSTEVPNEVSSIFPCTMTTTRSIEKRLWLRCDVEESWFKRWSPATDP